MGGQPELRALLCVLAIAVAVGGAAARRPHAYPHPQQDWEQLRRRCEGLGGGCVSVDDGSVDGGVAAWENCVRR